MRWISWFVRPLRFKSLVRLSVDSKYKEFGGRYGQVYYSSETKTTYDLNSVQSHEVSFLRYLRSWDLIFVVLAGPSVVSLLLTGIFVISREKDNAYAAFAKEEPSRRAAAERLAEDRPEVRDAILGQYEQDKEGRADAAGAADWAAAGQRFVVSWLVLLPVFAIFGVACGREIAMHEFACRERGGSYLKVVPEEYWHKFLSSLSKR